MSGRFSDRFVPPVKHVEGCPQQIARWYAPNPVVDHHSYIFQCCFGSPTVAPWKLWHSGIACKTKRNVLPPYTQNPSKLCHPSHAMLVSAKERRIPLPVCLMPRFKAVNFDRFVITVSMVLVDLVVFAVRPDACVCPGRWRNVKAPASTMDDWVPTSNKNLRKPVAVAVLKRV